MVTVQFSRQETANMVRGAALRDAASEAMQDPLLATLLPASISNHLAPYLPSNAGGVIWGGAAHLPNALAPWTGFALLCGYAAVLIGAGAWRLR
jgi:hypothetical protein